ncbi:MAG: hypothetical protein KKD01_19010, partial [Proteobacteria bacterium]|nr:hypothetical protein [Pseudomonadota bacterium]
TFLSRVVVKNGETGLPSAPHSVTIDHKAMIVSGTLESDETWSGTVYLEGDVIVPSGITLTVQPGTRVYFPQLLDRTFSGNNSSKTELIIHGTLIAEGTEVEPVAFVPPLYASRQPGDWYGILVTGSLFMDYAHVKYAESGIRFLPAGTSSTFSVSHTTISHNSLHGISISVADGISANVELEDNTIIYNQADGIYCYVKNNTSALDLNINRNIISNNGAAAIYCQTASDYAQKVISGRIQDNIIFDHLAYGIYFNINRQTAANLTLENNSIYQSATGLFAGFYSSSSNSAITIQNNRIYSGSLGILLRANNAVIAPEIHNNAIYDHVNDGIRLERDSSAANSLLPNISGNEIYENKRSGLVLQVTGAIALHNNSFFGNYDYDLYNDSPYAIDASVNWWGVETTNLIYSSSNPRDLSAIYDAFDNANKGEVDYSDWLTLFDPPAQPTLDTVSSPTGLDFQTLSGTKEGDTGILINGHLGVAVDQEISWNYDYPLVEGKNSLTLQATNGSGMLSRPLYSGIIKDTTAPLLYSSFPANGSILARPVYEIEMVLLEETTGVDATATAQGVVVDAFSNPIAGEWILEQNTLRFTPSAPFGDGQYTVTLTPTDQPLGNSSTAEFHFTIDLGAPAVPTLEPVESPTRNEQVTIRGSKESGTSLWLNSTEIIGLNDSTDWSYSLTLKDVVNVFSLSSRDRAGNRSDSVTFSIVLDQNPPILTKTEPINNSFFNQRPESVTLTFSDLETGVDAGTTLATAEIFSKGGLDVPGSWSMEQSGRVQFIPGSPFVEESYFVRVTARDEVGNGRETKLSYTYDATPPSVPVLNPVTSPTKLQTQILSGTKEANSSLRINSREVIEVNEATTWSYALVLEEGKNAFYIDSADAAGNISGIVEAVIQYDETSPLTVDTLKVSGDGPGDTAYLDWNGYNEVGQGDIAYYRIYTGSALFTQVAERSPYGTVPAGKFTSTVTGLSKDSVYYFAVVAVDNKGNAHTSVTPVSARIQDVQAPEPVTGLSSTCSENSITFTWQESLNSGADLKNYRYVFQNGDPTDLQSGTTITFSELATASGYSFAITAVDEDNNESGAATTIGATLLPNPEKVEIIPHSGYVSLSWSAVAPTQYVKHYAVYVSTSEFHSIVGMEPNRISDTPSARVARLENGTAYYFAVATINLSNGSLDTVTSFTATPNEDTEGPLFGAITVNGETLVDGMTFGKTAVIAVEASDPASVSRVEFFIDSESEAKIYAGTPYYSWSWNVVSHEDGPHNLTIQAYDSLGNVSEKTFQVNTLLVVPEPPEITEPKTATITNKEQQYIRGIAEVETTVRVINNGVTVAESGTDHKGVFSGELILTEGENILEAVAANRVGDSEVSSSVIVFLDTTLPSKPRNVTAVPKSGGQVKLSWQAPVDESVAGYTLYRSASPFDGHAQATKLNTEMLTVTAYTDLTPEDHVWYYRVSCIDQAGNEGLLSDPVTVLTDRVAPRALDVSVISHGKTDG